MQLDKDVLQDIAGLVVVTQKAIDEVKQRGAIAMH